MYTDMLKITFLLCHKIVTSHPNRGLRLSAIPAPLLSFLPLATLFSLPLPSSNPSPLFSFLFIPEAQANGLERYSLTIANYSLATPTGAFLPSYYQEKDKICSAKGLKA
ncbi:hypothetical protein CEXT_673481 [Caerostris extrusa]|uniref:Uncharacterized protein n=1 Tax=Caerostris extrusa TaxID=172846 RepID=A0AAV4NA52_CAEEX|nr:hypothetical protein CEXT_673481 [Caerostris extrusa]